MKNIGRYKVEISLLISLILFAIISITSIYNASYINDDLNNLYLKQALWYGLGFFIAYFIMYLGNDLIIKSIKPIYILGVISLLLLFVFGSEINGAKCWYVIPGIGSFQPSEFMKIIIIIYLAKITDEFNSGYKVHDLKEELKYLFDCFKILLIPSILTLLQPDTGAVLMYGVIFVSIAFISGLRYRWFVGFLVTLILTVTFVLIVYNTNKNMFIDIFGTSFFYRVERIIEWKQGSGMQLNNALTSISSAGIFGHGRNIPLYFPESQNDFIFAVIASNYGIIGAILLVLLIIFFNTKLITISSKTNININKYLIAGILGMILFQQIQNIGMNIGLFPIIGITLPFISYGGSSLISYMILIGIIFSISNDNLRYSN